jgi:hypothetical protein
MATSKVKQNRSWDDIESSSGSARHYVAIYLRACKALFKSGVTEEEKSIFQSLTHEQLKITSTTIDPAVRGTRNTSLAWFWRMNIQGDTQRGGDMEECKAMLSICM